MRVFMVVLAFVLAPGLSCAAQTPSEDPVKGHMLAQRWCSSCHAVEPMTQEKSTDVAPSFSSVANTPSTSSMSLHAFLQTSHGQMPDFKLSRDQIDDVVAYILSLRKR
jgi:cytochrome c